MQKLKKRFVIRQIPGRVAMGTKHSIAESEFDHLNDSDVQASSIFLYEKSREVRKRAVYFQGFGYFCLHHHSRPLLKYLSGKKIPAFIQCQSLTARIVGAIYLMLPLFEHWMDISRHVGLAKPMQTEASLEHIGRILKANSAEFHRYRPWNSGTILLQQRNPWIHDDLLAGFSSGWNPLNIEK